jgi:hypothetical protein
MSKFERDPPSLKTLWIGQNDCTTTEPGGGYDESVHWSLRIQENFPSKVCDWQAVLLS